LISNWSKPSSSVVDSTSIFTRAPGIQAANSGEDGGYAAKVLAHQSLLRLIAAGGKVRTTVAATPAPKPQASAEAAEPAHQPAPPTPAPVETPAAPDKVALLH